MAEIVNPKKMPKRLKYKLASNGERIKFFFDEDVGGSYLSYTKLLEEVLRHGRLEGYADFVGDSDTWKKRADTSVS